MTDLREDVRPLRRHGASRIMGAMSRGTREQFEDEDDEGDPDEDRETLSARDEPDEADRDDADDADDETTPCPFCGKPVYEQAELCPHCGNYLSTEDAPRHRPWWIWVGVILCLAGVLLWFF